MIENFTHRTADRNFARRQRPVDFAAEGSRLALCLHHQLRNPGLIQRFYENADREHKQLEG